jgi:tetratricopeptide (TPR) repeat protein
MKKIITLFLIVFSLNILAEDLSFKEIKSLYHKSYDYEKMEKYQKAISVLNNVYEAYPKTYTINLRLGWLYYLNGNYNNSLEHLKKAIAVSTQSSEVLNVMNLVHAAQKDWDEVSSVSQKIIINDYYNESANYWISVAYRMKGQFELAEKVALKMLTVKPTSVTFLNEYGIVQYAKGNYDPALSTFQSVIILDPDNQSATYYLELLQKK